MLIQQWPTEEHYNYQALWAQLHADFVSKLNTFRLKANWKDCHRVFKLVKSQSKFVKAITEDQNAETILLLGNCFLL